MKKLIGHDIYNGATLGTYTFNPSTKQIAIIGLPFNLSLEQLLLITDVNANIIIYNFAVPALGATISNNVITLDYSCAGLVSTDPLQIYVDVPDTAPVDNAAQVDSYTHLLLERICDLLEPMATQDSANRQRVAIDNIAGSLTLGTVSTLSAITAGPVIGSAFFTRITDATNTAAVKAASTAPALADPALVVSISPNNFEWQQMDWARQSYDCLRSKLTFSN